MHVNALRFLAPSLILTTCVFAQPVVPVPSNTGSRADLNTDGYIDGADLAVLIDILSGTNRDPIANARADLNADGRVDHLDLTALVQILAGDGARGSGDCPDIMECCNFAMPYGCCNPDTGACFGGQPGEGEGGGDPGGIGGGDPGDIGGGGGGPGDPPDPNDPNNPPDEDNPCNYRLCVTNAADEYVPITGPLQAVDTVTVYAVRDPDGIAPTLVSVTWYLLDDLNQPLQEVAGTSFTVTLSAEREPGVYSLGTKCGDPLGDRGAMPLALYRMKPMAITFGGGNHIIYPDNPDDLEPYDEEYTDDHWYDHDGNGATDDDIPNPGDHSGHNIDRRLPVAYTRNTPMAIAEFEPWVDTGETPTGDPNPGPTGFKYRATYDLDGPHETVFAGDYPSVVPAVANASLPDHIAHEPEYTLEWEVSFTGGDTWFSIGSTNHEVYVTLATPTGQRLESMYHIATKNAIGQTTPSGALNAIWAKFATRSVQNKRGDTLGYYRDPNGSECYNGTDQNNKLIVTARALVNESNGQCGAWIGLFGNTLRIHGITGQGIRVQPDPDFFGYNCSDHEINWRNNLRMLIQNWTFDASPESGCIAFPYRINHSCGNEWPTWQEPDVIPGPGASGQDSANPRSVFQLHILYKADLNELIYDVSYGNGPFLTTQQWEDLSVAGFATTINLLATNRLRGAMKHVSAAPHTTSTLVTIPEVAP